MLFRSITGFLDINPNVASLPTDNHVRLPDQYGRQYENWQGVDVNMSARLGAGTLVQGGFSSGRQVQDNCAVLKQIPESGFTTQQGLSSAILPISGALAVPYCHQQTPIITQVKLLGTYTVPRVDVQVAAAFQSVPGPMITSTFIVPNAVVSQSLGRNLSGNAQNVSVEIVAPGSLYGDRMNQFDLRFGKTIRFAGSRRITPSLDIYNMLNSSAALAEATTYSQFRVPTRVVGGRMAKFTVLMNF